MVVGPNVFRIADPDDPDYPLQPTTYLVDLNELEADCDGTGWLLIDAPSFAGRFTAESLAGAPGERGDQQGDGHQGDDLMTFALGYRGAADGDVLAAARDLATAMARSRVFIWQLHGDDALQWIDFRETSVPKLLRGQRGGMYQIARKLIEPGGFQVVVATHPDPRIAPVEFGPVEVTNGLNDRHVVVTNPGNEPGELYLRIEPTAGVLAAVEGGLRSTGNQTEYRAGYMAALSGKTLGVDTASAAVAGASGAGGTAAVVTFATEDTLRRRVRESWVPADPLAIEGLFRHKLRVRNVEVTADRSDYRLQVRYGFSTADSAMERTPRRAPAFDFRDLSADDWTEVDLGLVRVDRGAGRLVLEVWAQRLHGDGHLALDLRELKPAGEHGFLAGINGFRQGEWGREVYDADELGGTGHERRGVVRLDESGELARIFPAAGLLLGAGTHVFSARGVLREPDDPAIVDGPNPTAKVVGELQVLRDSGAGLVPWRRLRLRNRRDRPTTDFERALAVRVSAADEAAAYRYLAQVVLTADTLDGRRVDVAEIAHEFQLGVTSDDAMVLDAFSQPSREYVETDGMAVAPLHLESSPILVPSGECTIPLTLIELPGDPGYADLDEREQLGTTALARAAIVSGYVVPRRSQ